MTTSGNKGPNYPLDNFPRLNPNNSTVTSPTCEAYNCLAWAVGIEDKSFWPDAGEDIILEPAVEWPPEIPNEETVDAFVAFFRRFEFEICEDAEFEEEYVKIAIFVDHNGYPTHACRQLPDKGKWTSKMGIEGVDIELDDLSHIEGISLYGTARVYMKKHL